MTIRFDRIKAHKVGPFTDLDIDLSALSGVITAVCGDNGAGKSTFLELFAGGLFRDCPTRGTLVSLATARDSFVEVSAVNGHAWTMKHSLDAVSGKSEVLVTDADGAAALPDTKVKFFDQWAKTHLPAPEVLYASTFAAQGSAGFLGLRPGDRKAVLLRVLGVERLEGLAKSARENATAAKQAIATLDARIADERARSGDVEAARARLVAADADVVACRDRLVSAREELRAWQAERALLDAAQLEVKRHEERAASLRAAIASEEKTRSDLADRVRNNRGVLDREAEIRDAVATRAQIVERIATVRAEMAAKEARVASAIAAVSAVQAAARTAERRRDEAVARRDSVLARRDEATKQAAQRDEIAQAVANLPAATADRDAAREAVTHAEAALEEVRSQRVVGAEGRVSALRAGLTRVVEDPPDGLEIATQALAEDDDAVELAASLPGRTKVASDALLAAKHELAGREARISALTALESKLPAAERAAKEARAAASEAVAANAEVLAAEADLLSALEAETKATKARVSIDDHGGVLPMEEAALSADLRRLEPIAALLPKVEGARARLAELEPQGVAAESRIAALRAELGLVPTPGALAALRPAPLVDEGALRAAERAATHAGADVTRAEEGAARLVALDADRQRARDEADEWMLLADGLGRDGLQAAEIDAAGPELTALINDLLHTCVGTRWTVTVDTQRASADGKKVIEGLEVSVLDTIAGREAPAETLSGGEQVLVGEAVSLALAMLACRRSGVAGPTLVRDETGAALSPANGHAYFAMLRRAAEVVGASRVLIVTHTPELADLADSRIFVSGGTAVVS